MYCCAAGYMCARRLGGSPTVVWLTGPPAHHSWVQQPYSLFPSCESSPLFHFRLLPPPSFLSFFWLSSSSSTHKPKGRRKKYKKIEPPSQSFHQSVLFFAPSLFVLSSPFYFIFFFSQKKNPPFTKQKNVSLFLLCMRTLMYMSKCLCLLFARPMLVVHKKKTEKV